METETEKRVLRDQYSNTSIEYTVEYRVFRGRRYSESKSDYRIVRENKQNIERSHRKRAEAVAALCEQYPSTNLLTESPGIPIAVGLDGKTAIATYLYGIEECPLSEVADMLDVSAKTVKRYRLRFDPTRKTKS